MSFKRFHPYRISPQVRDKQAEVTLQANDFIVPYFVVEGQQIIEPIESLWGINRFSVDTLIDDVGDIMALGLNKVLLFGVVDDVLKTENGDASFAQNNLVERAIIALRKHYPHLLIITDICICAYTSHGHCGLLNSNGIDNDRTLPVLAQMALNHARAGANMVAPSAMMDGQVAAIRNILDLNHFTNVGVLAYSAKYSSNFYGPFRDAAQSAPSFGDRKAYQMDYRTIKQGTDEILTDIDEGAAWVMVKPAHTYLDVITRGKLLRPDVPMAAYHVSGEYMMVQAAAANGLLNLHDAMCEVLTAIKRAGADYIISYYARQWAANQPNNKG